MDALATAPRSVDPYRDHWLALRQSAIQHVRLHRVIAAQAPPEARCFIQAVIASATEQVRAIERWTACRPWDGA